jgi:hypothetical protein
MELAKLRYLTILQAEDDPSDVFLLRHAFKLEQVSNPLQTVRDGEEALAYLPVAFLTSAFLAIDVAEAYQLGSISSS